MTETMRRGKALPLVGALAVAGAAFAMGVARLTSNGEGAPGSEMPLDDAYALMSRAMSRPGMVLRAVSTARNDASPSCVSTTEAWISERGEEVRTRSSYHCEGVNDATTRQHFSDHGGCVEGSITQASEDSRLFGVGFWWESRWHARCNVVSLPSLVGYWSACTPHWDETDSDCPSAILDIPGNHYVPDVFNTHVSGQGNWPGSGFDAARDLLGAVFIVAGFNGLVLYFVVLGLAT